MASAPASRRCVDALLQLRKSPVLDVGCGFGRNAVALALRGLSVVCVDQDRARLQAISELAPPYISRMNLPPNEVGKLHPICSRLSQSSWPFSQNCFSAIVCVHFLEVALFDLFRSSLVAGGYLYIETFGGQGRNYVDLPKAGRLRNLLSTHFQLLRYRERRVGPRNCGAVAVKLLARMS
jgi:SAM-dependent methyltransferase